MWGFGMSRKKHETLVHIIADVLRVQGLHPEVDVEYQRGQLDVRCGGIYYEVKCNMNKYAFEKGQNQIYRAMQWKQARKGVIVTYDGVYEV